MANTYREKKRERKGENLVEVVNLGGDEREDARSLRNALEVNGAPPSLAPLRPPFSLLLLQLNKTKIIIFTLSSINRERETV